MQQSVRQAAQRSPQPSLRRVLPSQRRAVGLGAMTAALVIVPDRSASARSVSVQGVLGSRVAGGSRNEQGDLPWMVRLSTGGGAASDTAQRSSIALPRAGSTGNNVPRLAAVPSYRVTHSTF
jgi:hypothetical protein